MKTANALAALELGSLRSSALWGDAVMHLELSKVLKRVKRVRLRHQVQISAQICGALQSALRTPHRGRRHENMQIFTGSMATSNYNTLMVIYLDESSQKDLSYLVHRISDW